ncbi:MAG: hypothetical protein WBB17_15780 [Saprospiraceae bacterium]
MKKNVFVKMIFLLAIVSQSCVAPVNSLFDNASMLEKGASKIQGNVSHYRGAGKDFEKKWIDEGSNTNIGLAYAYGLSKKVNLAARYEFLNGRTYEDNSFGANESYKSIGHYFSASARIRIKDKNMSVLIPVEFYFLSAADESAGIQTVSPQFIYTHEIISSKLDVTIAPKIVIPLNESFTENDYIPYTGLNIGLGLGKDLSKYSLRPELGILFNPQNMTGFNYNFGVGFTAKL